ncbi:hypothetical protein MBLNU459_g0030t1 [Dothideomycetes sp. NU459]
MAGTDDAATVLDQFCHDVANLPAEIAHLLEEIQAKDQQMQECRDVISSKDKLIQNFVRQNGGHVKNPKEESLAKIILANYDRMEILQAEKLGLSQKSAIIVGVPLLLDRVDSDTNVPIQLDRQVKRFDLKLRQLQDDGQLPPDPTLPSLLQPSANSSVPISGVTTPSNALTINTAQGGGAPTIANTAMRAAAAGATRTASPMVAQNPLLNQPHLNGGGNAARSQRESSADAAKRRRLTSSMTGNVPATSSSLRQSSLGPSSGTPKAGTPVPSSSRAGSAQPSRPATTKKAPSSKKLAPNQAAAIASARKRVRTSTSGVSRKDRKRHLTSPTPSSSRGSASPTPSTLPQGGADGAADSPAGDEQEGDEIYCVCQQVSFGDMVACDNDNCPYQWFHWQCVGLKAEPKGEWLCPHCRDLPKEKIVKAKDDR